jgi:glycosyltransferase involved in cell wall biosynthesis
LVSKDDVTVVIPILNEKEAIVKVLDELKGFGYEKILVVDGYSTDGTRELAAQRSVNVVGQVGKGKTGAVLTAVNHVATPYLLVMDGDYTYDPSSIERMLVHASAYDEIIGARTMGRQYIPMLNRLGNRLINWLFKILFAVRLSDVCSGMYLLRTNAARSMEFTTAGFDVEVEIAAQVATHGNITEVPVNYRRRLGKQKLSSLRHGLQILTSIIRLANLQNPVLLYSGFMALSVVPAVLVLTWVAYETLVRSTWHGGYALFAVMLLVLAAQALSVATISLLIKRSEQRMTRRLRRALGVEGEDYLDHRTPEAER